MKPMTYREIRVKLQKEKQKVGLTILRFSEKGILVAGEPDPVDLFDALMDRYVPTHYERDKNFGDMDFSFYVRTYRRVK